jgi:PAT family beta-lactamase induction signal transducer AmpG
MLTPSDPITAGGMGLTTQDVGVIYGTLVLVSNHWWYLGGIVISRDGLGKWMLPMILAMHLPIIGFIYHPIFTPVPFSIFMQQ